MVRISSSLITNLRLILCGDSMVIQCGYFTILRLICVIIWLFSTAHYMVI